MKVLLSRLLDFEQQKAADERASQRRDQVGSGERSEKIRTYNYAQNRVTDHRASVTLHKLDQILEGEMDALLSAVRLELSEHFDSADPDK
jgi:peptide chain release factor 1